MKNVMVCAATGACLFSSLLCGCSADIEVDNSKSNGKPKAELTAEQKAAERARAAREAEDAKDDAEQAKYSTTNAAPLYVTKPMAWFARTNEKMQFTRQKLLEAQARISVICGKYERQMKSGGNKSKGYVELLDKAEKARIEGQTQGWPVAFDQWVINDEAALDAKIAEINVQMGKNRGGTVEDTAMYNGAKKALKQIRERLVAFDDAYVKFQRTWDKVKLGELGGISVELEKEVNEAIDITEIFINEWNKVK